MIWPLLTSLASLLATPRPHSIFELHLLNELLGFFVVFVSFHFLPLLLLDLSLYTLLFGRNMHISFACLTAISDFSLVQFFHGVFLDHRVEVRRTVFMFPLSLSQYLLLLV